jgi:hypothetical protein
MFEIVLLDDHMKSYIKVEAPDEETAIFLAGMKFSEMDLNTETLHVDEVRNLGSRF